MAVPDTRTLAQVYRHFGEAQAAKTSPVYAHLAVALSESDDALRAIEGAPAGTRHPAVILAALHDLALAGRAPALAAAFAQADLDGAAAAAIDALRRMAGPVLAAARRRPVWKSETGRGAVLYPAIGEAARRAGAHAVALIDVGSPAGLNLTVERVGIAYSNGQTLGDPRSGVQLSCSVVGSLPIPARALPEVVARVVVDRDPFDITDPDDARWLRACLPPDQTEAAASLDAELALATAAPPLLLRGGPVEMLAEALSRVPSRALPVVVTTWALSRLAPERRVRFRQRLAEASSGRPVAWVSVEGVGVAPSIPTLGDRPASGHSIVALAMFEGPAGSAEALARCWLRGRFLEWVAAPA